MNRAEMRRQAREQEKNSAPIEQQPYIGTDCRNDRAAGFYIANVS